MEENLPNGWIAVKLGDICSQPQYGYTTSAANRGSVKFLRITDISSGTVDWESVPFCKTSPDDIDKYKLNKNDILIARTGASVGSSFRIENPPYISAFASYLIRFNPISNPKFVEYFLKSSMYWNFISSSASGSAQPNVNATKLSNLPIPLPPLAEQNRIVKKLDGTFDKLKKAEEILAEVPKMIEDFRKSVLYHAVTGKLTEEWRETNNSSEWGVDELRNLTTKVGSGATPKGGQESYKSEGIPLIRSMNVHFGGINYTGLAYINEQQADKLKNAIVHHNDVLLNITGASIGRSCLVPKELDGARVNQHVSIIRPNKRLNSEYLNFFISSPKIQYFIVEENHGTTRQALTKGQILEMQIPLPSLEEQKVIIERVNNKLSVIEFVNDEVSTSLAEIEKVRNRLLSKAFRGELVPQDPNDEPASVLLKKIQIEKQRLEAELKAKRKQRRSQPKKKPVMKNLEIIEVLKINGQPMKAEEVWKESKYKEDIDAFYEQLRHEVEVAKNVQSVVETDQETYLNLIENNN